MSFTIMSKFKGNAVLLSMTLALLNLIVVACSNDENELPSNTGTYYNQAITIDAGVKGWYDSTRSTRASYSGASESAGIIDMPMDFTTGDAIGVYGVDRNGKVKLINRKFVYDGSKWKAEVPVPYVVGMADYKYYAYYPYKDELAGGPKEGDDADITENNSDDDAFFSSAISEWPTENDQSSLAGFTMSDMMTAKATVSYPLYQEIHLSFNFKHRMGLLITKTSLDFYDEDNPSDKWSVTQYFSGNIPYAIPSNKKSDERYFIVKPDVETTLGTKTTKVGPGEVEYLYFPKGEPSKR